MSLQFLSLCWSALSILPKETWWMSTTLGRYYVDILKGAWSHWRSSSHWNLLCGYCEKSVDILESTNSTYSDLLSTCIWLDRGPWKQNKKYKGHVTVWTLFNTLEKNSCTYTTGLDDWLDVFCNVFWLNKQIINRRIKNDVNLLAFTVCTGYHFIEDGRVTLISMD